MAEPESRPEPAEERVSLNIPVAAKGRRLGVGSPHRSGDEAPDPSEAYVKTPPLRSADEVTRYGP
jgi:hypothetical protein